MTAAAEPTTMRVTDEAMRAQLLRGLMQNGMDRADAAHIVDVAMHAASEGLKTITRICDALDGAEWFNAYTIALQLGAQLCQGWHLEMAAKATEAIPTLQPRSFAVDFRQ